MADGPVGPDLGALRALIEASKGPSTGSGCAPIFMGARLEVNVGAGLSPQPLSFIKADNPLRPALSRRGDAGLSKLFKDIMGGGIMEGMKKCAEAGAPRQISNPAELFGNANSGLNGGFTASTGPSDNGPIIGA